MNLAGENGNSNNDSIRLRGGKMKRRNIKRRLGMSLVGLMCLLLFLGTKEESCSSCSNLDEMLETKYGTLKIVNFLDLDKFPEVTFKAYQQFSDSEWDENPNLRPDSFIHTWNSPSDEQVSQKKLKSGFYKYLVFTYDPTDAKDYLYDAGMLTVPFGETFTLKIK
jgi:hypothetical protein